MKKFLVALILLAGVTAVGFAAFSSKKKTGNATEKKTEKKKKECSRKCMYSL